MKKPTIFISHINEEKDIANSLKDFLENKFLGIANVFASSHEDSLQLGDKWMDRIHDSIKGCNLVIILCSPISVTRQWINFEAGAGWIQGIPVIPLCHSGMELSKLPVPINSFQGGVLNNIEDVRKLFKRISKELDIKEPEIKDEAFFSQINGFENDIKNSRLFNDTKLVYELLASNLLRIKLLIFESTYTEENQKKILNVKENNPVFYKLENYTFKLSDTYTCFLDSTMGNRDEIVCEDLLSVSNKLTSDIKFVLNYNRITIAPFVQDILHNFLVYQSAYSHHLVQLVKVGSDKEIETIVSQIMQLPDSPSEVDVTKLINPLKEHYSMLSNFYSFLQVLKKFILDLQEAVIAIIKTHGISY